MQSLTLLRRHLCDGDAVCRYHYCSNVLLQQGACMTLLSVRVYYISCDAAVLRLASFPATPAGRDAASVVKATGTCVANSNGRLATSHQSALCKADGSWFVVTEGCVCEAGYQPTSDNKSCTGFFVD